MSDSTPAEVPIDKSTEARDESETAAPDEADAAAPDSRESPEPKAQGEGGPPDSPTSGRFPLSVSRPVALISVAVVAVLVITAVTLGVVLLRRAAVERASSEALATARSYAVTVTSYDYRTLDRNFTDVLNGATGEFKDQYGAASKTLRNLVTQAQATAKGTVLNAGVESASTDRVVVLLFMDQAISNASTHDPRVDRSRLLMTLTRNDGRWLASKVELR